MTPRHPGAQRKTTREQDAGIIAQSQANPFMNAVQIREALNVQVCTRTIRNRLHEGGRHCRTPAKKPALTPAHAEARLRFCRENLDRDWSRVIFSDEKTFSSSIDSPVKLWRPKNERYTVEHVKATASSGRISAGFWGWMTSLGPGNLVGVSPPRFTANRYIEVIRNFLFYKQGLAER